MNKPQNILSERIEKLGNELQIMTTCRDHWKTSYDDIKSQLQQAQERVKELEIINEALQASVRDWAEDARSLKEAFQREHRNHKTAQAENDVLRNFFNVTPKEKEAEKAAESLLKHYKHWGCGHYNAGVCSECYESQLQQAQEQGEEWILPTDDEDLAKVIKSDIDKLIDALAAVKGED